MKNPRKIVDTHQHVNWHQHNVTGSIRDMDEHGISYSWLLTWFTEPDDPEVHSSGALNPVNVRLDGSQEGITLRDIVEAKEKHPQRYVVGYCPNPRWRLAPIYLRNAHHMHGAQVCGEWKYRMFFDDPRCLEIFHVAGELKMPVVLHLDVPYLVKNGRPEYQPNWYGGTVENLERALQACPETIFIGHAPGFWREISADAATDGKPYPDAPISAPGELYRLFDSYENLYADLSAGSGRIALQRDPQHAVSFLQKYSHRLLFGRDQYEQKLHPFLQTLPLDEATINRIYYQNAERLIPAP